MSSKQSLPPDATKLSSDPESSGAPRSPAELSPRTAILNAAIVSLEYAKQYLDKFTHWPDYILATHYQASVLALTGRRKNLEQAERCFQEVEDWLRPTKTQLKYDEARKRIRAEAMYNRAVLLQFKGETERAKDQFNSVLNLVGRESEEPPKGVRFATEFALLVLVAGQLRLASSRENVSGRMGDGPLPNDPNRTASLEMEWQALALSFLANCTRQLQELERELNAAEAERASADAKFKVGGRDQVPTAKGGWNQPSDRGKRGSDIGPDRGDPQIRITKASKDLAIVRMMEDTAKKFQKEFVANSTSSAGEDWPDSGSEERQV
jgi:hypothetical protein